MTVRIARLVIAGEAVEGHALVRQMEAAVGSADRGNKIDAAGRRRGRQNRRPHRCAASDADDPAARLFGVVVQGHPFTVHQDGSELRVHRRQHDGGSRCGGGGAALHRVDLACVARAAGGEDEGDCCEAHPVPLLHCPMLYHFRRTAAGCSRKQHKDRVPCGNATPEPSRYMGVRLVDPERAASPRGAGMPHY